MHKRLQKLKPFRSYLTIAVITYILAYILILLITNRLIFRPHAPGYSSEEFPKLITENGTITTLVSIRKRKR